MTRLQEIQQALIGCVKILLRDQSAQQNFNLSLSGLWFSFAALPLTVFLNIVQKSVTFQISGVSGISTGDIIGFSASILVSWVIFLLILSVFGRNFGINNDLPTFVIVYNWSQFALNLFWTVLSILLVGISGDSALGGIGLLVMFFSYVYLFLVLKDTLPLDSGVAAGICFVEFAIGILINYAAIHLFLSELIIQ